MGTNTMNWSKRVNFRPSLQRLSSSAQLTNCNFATCWHVELSKLSLLHLLQLSFIQHSFQQWVQMSYQVHSFENSHWAALGRILGRCLCNHRKTLMSSVYLCLFPREGFPRQTCKNYLRRNKNLTHGSNLNCRLYDNSIAPALGGACAMETNTMALIQTS